ncbi:MAG: RIP metalloprotease RseP [Verrucomicrobiaceae bacterium]|nr:RIP metalloprotease RseP [Verrucomicrobiaceae bacterium]
MSWLFDILRPVLLILEVILVFNLMIVVHEWGHFLAARWRGLKIDRFYVWFGKPLWRKTINGVEYGLGSIPFGGYVALPQMAPMGGLEGESNHEQLPTITPLDKIIVAFAGPLFSFLLACVFAVSVWFFGKPQSESHSTSIVGHVAKGSPAEKAGIKAGDIVKTVDGDPVKRFEGLVDSVRWSMVASEGETIPFEVERPGQPGLLKFDVNPKDWKTEDGKPLEAPQYSWWQSIFKRPDLREVGLSGQSTPVAGIIMKNSPADDAGLKGNDIVVRADGQPLRSTGDLSDLIRATPGKTINLSIEREGQVLELPVTPRVPDKNNMKEIGDKKEFPMIGIQWDTEGKRNLTRPGPTPKEQIYDAVKHMGALVDKLTSPRSDLGLSHMSGPVGVGRLYYKLFQHPDGWRLVLWFSVVFNINLAILNMMPFPVLDGGHITMALAEIITRRTPRGMIIEYIQTACAMLLFGFLIFVTFKDAGDVFSSWIFGGSKKDSQELQIEWLPKDKRPAATTTAP